MGLEVSRRKRWKKIRLVSYSMISAARTTYRLYQYDRTYCIFCFVGLRSRSPMTLRHTIAGMSRILTEWML